MTVDFPGNSHKANSSEPEEEKEEEDLQPLPLTGKVVRRKKPLGRRFKEMFFSGDTNSVFGYLVKDVLVPALQDMATDLVKQGIERAVYGEVQSPHSRTRRSSSSRGGPSGTHISYDRYGSSPSARPAAAPGRRVRGDIMDIGEIIVDTRAEAEMVMEKMERTLERYPAVTVADLYGWLGQTSEWTDRKFGWMDLDGANIRRVRGGYLLVLPEAEDLR